MEDLMINFEKIQRKNLMYNTYDKTIKLCELILKKKRKKIPKKDLGKIKLFKKEFVDKGLIDKSHYITINELYAYRHGKKSRKKLEKSKYIDNTYLKTLELAIEELLLKK